MGYVTASLRVLYLMQMRSDLEYKMMLITQASRDLSRSTSDILKITTDLDPDSPIVKNLNARMQKLQAIEKQLELKMEHYSTRLKAIEEEINATKGMIDSGMKRIFSHGSG